MCGFLQLHDSEKKTQCYQLFDKRGDWGVHKPYISEVFGGTPEGYSVDKAQVHAVSLPIIHQCMAELKLWLDAKPKDSSCLNNSDYSFQLPNRIIDKYSIEAYLFMRVFNRAQAEVQRRVSEKIHLTFQNTMQSEEWHRCISATGSPPLKKGFRLQRNEWRYLEAQAIYDLLNMALKGTSDTKIALSRFVFSRQHDSRFNLTNAFLYIWQIFSMIFEYKTKIRSL